MVLSLLSKTKRYEDTNRTYITQSFRPTKNLFPKNLHTFTIDINPKNIPPVNPNKANAMLY